MYKELEDFFKDILIEVGRAARTNESMNLDITAAQMVAAAVSYVRTQNEEV